MRSRHSEEKYVGCCCCYALQCLLPRWQRTQEQHRTRARQNTIRSTHQHQQQGRPDTVTEPRGENNNIKRTQNNKKLLGKTKTKKDNRVTPEREEGGIAYERVKEEKTRNPSWVHELWDEVLL